jgi:hypothetical protein
VRERVKGEGVIQNRKKLPLTLTLSPLRRSEAIAHSSFTG